MINPMSRTDGGPAFATDPDPKAWEGMSLRDWFAGMALTGILSDYKRSEVVGSLIMRAMPDSPQGEKLAAMDEAASRTAYRFADAMLKARRSGNGPSNAV